MRTALVIGSSGLVGSTLLVELQSAFKVIGTYCNHPEPGLRHVDVRNFRELESVIKSVNPDTIVCPAAIPDVEFCEKYPELSSEINVKGLRNLVELSKRCGAWFVYFSSEYVFDGYAGPYGERDACNPLNEYGRQKLLCENMIVSELSNFIIARTSGVYGWEKQGKNFVLKLIRQLTAGRDFQVPADQVITPTSARDLARAVKHFIITSRPGLFHIAGSRPLLRTEFAFAVADVFELDRSFIHSVPTSELGLLAPRPRSAGLKTDFAQSLLDFPLSDPLVGLMEMKRDEHLQQDASRCL